MDILIKLPIDIQQIVYNFYVEKWFRNNCKLFYKKHRQIYNFVLDELECRFHSIFSADSSFKTNENIISSEEVLKDKKLEKFHREKHKKTSIKISREFKRYEKDLCYMKDISSRKARKRDKYRREIYEE